MQKSKKSYSSPKKRRANERGKRKNRISKCREEYGRGMDL